MSLEKNPISLNLGSAVLAIAACSADVPTDDPSRSLPAPAETTVSDDTKISMQLYSTALALQDVLVGLETGRCEIVTPPYEYKVVDQKKMRVECDKVGKDHRDVFEFTRFLPKDGRSRTAIVEKKQKRDNALTKDSYVAINFDRRGGLDAFRVDLFSHAGSFDYVFKCIPDSKSPFFLCGSPTAWPEEYARSILDKTSVATPTDQIRDRLDAIFSAAESPDVNRSRLLRQPGSKGHRNR